MRPEKERLDLLLVERGLAESREKAQALVLAGAVQVDGAPAGKPGHRVSRDCALDVTEAPKYVSRGGLKLEAAIREFAIGVRERICLDVGASTGGFTDCLLQHGAARVYAIDTGAGQFAWKLRGDPRVVLREKLNARYLRPEDIGEKVSLAVCDVSFVSVRLLLPAIVPLLTAGGQMVILVKPQFEAGRDEVGKGGIVRDPEVHRTCCARVSEAVKALGFQTALMESPILGTEGNKEFLLHAWR